MKDFLIAIGGLMIGLINIAIPILCGLSFGLYWDISIKAILIILCLVEAIIVTVMAINSSY